MGFSWPSRTGLQLPLFIEKLFQANLIKSNSFAFYLTPGQQSKGSYILFGGVDKKYYDGELQYHPVLRNPYWSLQLSSISYSNAVVTQNTNPVALINSGTSFLIAEPQIANPLMKQIGYSGRLPCDEVDGLLDIRIKIFNFEYRIPPKNYVIKTTQFGRTFCQLGVISGDLSGVSPATVMLGSVFMRTYFTHFDYTNWRIGFAPAKQTPNLSLE